MAGSFTWTGFDYKGEPNPYGWPDISNNTGLMDVCGFPKDKVLLFPIVLVGQADGASDARLVELAGQRRPEHPRACVQQRQAGRAVPERQKPGSQKDASRRPRGMAGSL